jgi:hypothetical protein
MRWIDGLSKAQRVAVVVALGLGLRVLGSYLVNLGSGFHIGWTGSPDPVFATAPLTASIGLPPLARALIWLALIGLWALGSIRVLRTPGGGSDTPAGPGRG